MYKVKYMDKPCEQCGDLMEGVTGHKRFCKECARKRSNASKRAYIREHPEARPEYLKKEQVFKTKSGWDKIWDKFKARRTAEELETVLEIAAED